MNLFYKNRGFTLMDILISVAVISLLSSVVLFQVTEAKKKAEDGHMKVEAQQVSTAIDLYKIDNNGFVPLTSSGGGVGTPRVLHSEENPESDYISTMQTLVNRGYLPEVPRSPNGKNYAYIVSEDFTEAVFYVGLNKPTSSQSTNSCQLTKQLSQENQSNNSGLPQYPHTFSSYVFIPGSCYQASSCIPGQATDDYSCFVVTNQVLNTHCSCGWSVDVNEWDVGVFPGDICQTYWISDDEGYGCQKYPVPNDIQYFYCSHDPVYIEEDEDEDENQPVNNGELGICDGFSNLDYCRCI